MSVEAESEEMKERQTKKNIKREEIINLPPNTYGADTAQQSAL